MGNGAVCLQLADEVKAEQKESSSEAKRSRTLGVTKRRVTFNPEVQKRLLPPPSKPTEAVTLKEAADIVVRYLDPYYHQGKFANKVGRTRNKVNYLFSVGV